MVIAACDGDRPATMIAVCNRDRRQRPKMKKPPRGGDGTGAGGLGFRGRGGGGGGSVDEVASGLVLPSSGSLTDSSKFDSCERQR